MTGRRSGTPGDGGRAASSFAGAVSLITWIRSPELGILGQGVRYAVAGGSVACAYALTTFVLSEVVGLPFQAALAIGFVTALVAHFTLQRLFVWAHHEEYALPLRRQLGRYLALAFTQYGLTALGTAKLPRLLGLDTFVVYIAIVITLAAINFLLFRTRVFHADATSAGKQ
jgi:putative flippase GtrA